VPGSSCAAVQDYEGVIANANRVPTANMHVKARVA
jgi:hypothetical protein